MRTCLAVLIDAPSDLERALPLLRSCRCLSFLPPDEIRDVADVLELYDPGPCGERRRRREPVLFDRPGRPPLRLHPQGA